MSQSIQFLLGKQQADKQADLIAAQTLNVVKEGAVLDQEVLFKQAQVRKMDQDAINSILEGTILTHQIDKIQAEIRLLDRQGDIAEAELAIAIAQLANQDAERLLILAKTDLTNNQAATELKMPTKIDEEVDLLQSQDLNTVEQTALVALKKATEQSQKLVLDSQKLKIDAEELLIDQKKVTESAQTQTGIAATDSVVGKQIILYGRQADGFLRDAEQKAFKVISDTWIVRRSSDPVGTAAFDTSNTNLLAILAKVKTGIGA